VSLDAAVARPQRRHLTGEVRDDGSSEDDDVLAGWLAGWLVNSRAKHGAGATALGVAAALASTLIAGPAAAIANGAHDTGNGFSFVVRLTGPGGTCSATVLTSRWLLTAAHCTHGRTTADSCGDPEGVFQDASPGWIGNGWSGTADVNTGIFVRTGYQADPVPDPNTPNTSLHVVAIHGLQGTLDPCSATQRAGDIALVQLNAPLPFNLPAGQAVTRFRPPVVSSPLIVGAPTCPIDDNFDGVIVGYGRDQLINGTGGVRTLNFIDDWDRDALSGTDKAAYWTTWTLGPTVPVEPVSSAVLLQVQYQYFGMAKGDSGGPLLQVDQNDVPIALCGVASGPKIVPVSPFIFITNDYAAVDPTPLVTQFITDRILYNTPANPTIDGWWEGECPPPNENAFLDTDGDGIPNACDNCPRTANPTQQVPSSAPSDWDFDGIDDVCDNCPFHPNPGQENADFALEIASNTPIRGDACDPCFGPNVDTDGDGCDDVCDLCPAVAGLGWNCGDFDDDGICDHADACTYVKSSPQNTNKISEIAHAAEPPAPWDQFWTPLQPFQLGDACEPVPTPRTEPVPVEVSPLFGQLCVGQDAKGFDRSTLEIFAQRSFPMHFTGASYAAGSLATPIRFCHKHGEVACDDQLGITDDWLDESECAAVPSAQVPGCTDPEEPDDYFHRMTFETAAMANGLDPDNPPANLSYNRYVKPWSMLPQAPSATWKWEYHADYARWSAGGLFLPGQDPGLAEVMRGVLWVHASTEIGDSVDIGTGLHGEQLANHHLVNWSPYGETCTSGMQWAPATANLLFLLVKNDKIETGPTPWDKIDAVEGEAPLVIPGDGGVWGHIGGTGAATFLAPLEGNPISEGFHYRLDDPSLRAFSAVEPFWEQGAGPAFPLVAWLNAEGGDEVVDLGLMLGDATLSSELDREICVDHFTCTSGYCSEENVCESSPAEPLGLGAPHAVDYVAVLSRTRRGLFVIGGDDVATGEPTGEIWFLPLELGSWTPLPVHEQPPEKVLAATYSWTTKSLYYLDEHDEGTRVSLVQVKVDQPAATVLATFSRNPAWSHHELVLDHDGALLLASSSPTLNKHRVARIAGLGGTLVVDGVEICDAPLAFPPMVDMAGYTLVTLVDGRRFERSRKKALDLQGPGALSLLGSQL
jgi:hypothetical protein